MLGFAGVTTIELSVAAVTVRVVLPDFEPKVAAIADVPAVIAVARPLALTVATVVVPEDHVTDAEIFCDVLSENVPVAVNCLVKPAGMDRLAGVTAMD
jgi:hypothetical protein